MPRPIKKAAPARPTVPGQRHTRQRTVIFDIICSAKGPLTVPEIHVKAKRSIPRTGVATVYRAIKLLIDAGLIQQVVLSSGDARYESSALGHHHHFQCRACGEVTDIDHCPFHMKPNSTLPGGYLVQSHEVTLYGLCPKCGAKPRSTR
jgi:Fur family ferric uptake transcriptional regulator